MGFENHNVPRMSALPTENEWEYACCGGKGNRQPFYFGHQLNGAEANCHGHYPFPFFTTEKGPYRGMTTEVGSFAAKYPHPW